MTEKDEKPVGLRQRVGCTVCYNPATTFGSSSWYCSIQVVTSATTLGSSSLSPGAHFSREVRKQKGLRVNFFTRGHTCPLLRFNDAKLTRTVRVT
jgi:hypothetical protein